MKKNHCMIIMFSLLVYLGCSGSIDSSGDAESDLQFPPPATDDGYLYGDFSLTVNGDPVQSSPAAKNYTYYVLEGTFNLPAVVDRYYKCCSLYEEHAGNSGYGHYYLDCANYIMEILNRDFYPYSSNTILSYTSGSGMNTIKVESVGVLDNSVIDRIELVVNNLQVTDFNTELTLNSSTPDRFLIFTYKNGTKFSSLMAGSSVKVVIGNLSMENDTTTITINSSTLFISTGGLESISLQGTLNAYRQEQE